jgi:tetratricopeptide (TPR) repeat protein
LPSTFCPPARFSRQSGNALFASESWEEAAMTYRRAAELAPTTPTLDANLGLALYRLDRLEQAVEAHRMAAKLRPDGARIWVNLSAAEVDLGDPDAALESARRALKLEADLPEAHNAAGMALKVKGMAADAIAAFETAIGCGRTMTRLTTTSATYCRPRAVSMNRWQPLRRR